MTRSKRMKPVKQVAEHREQDAARALGRALDRLAAERGKLEQLVAYRDEYARGFETRGGNGVGARELQNFHAFLGRLNAAIEQQGKVVAEAEQACEAQRRQWLQRRSRSEALGKVMERYHRDELRDHERREQADSDEHALQSHRRRRDDS